MCIRLLLLCFLLAKCHGIEIRLKKFDKKSETYAKDEEVVVNNLHNMKNFLNGLKIHNFVEMKYGGVEVFEGFGEVEYVWAVGNDLKVAPVFRDVPKLIAVDLSKNDIEQIKKETLSNTTVSSIFLANNNISKIEDGAFGSNVYWVQLACNALKTFSPAWFQNPKIVYALNLDGNQIEHFKSTDFSAFSNLYDINLSYNMIKRFEPGTLAYTDFFAWVHLHNNGLTDLDANVFKSSVTLYGLNIQYNNLTYLSNDFLKNIHLQQFANVVGNPWQCTCFEAIRRWVLWGDYGEDFFKKKGQSDPYCAKSLESPLYCDPDVPDKEELINSYAEAINVPVKKPEYCVKYLSVDFHPCAEKDLCFAYLP